MKKMMGRSIISLGLILLLFGGYYLLKSSTLPGSESNAVPASIMYKSVDIPKKLTFMGEEVPLTYNDVRESLDRELLVNSYYHSQTLRFLKLTPRFMSIIVPILEADTVPTDFAYLALAESGFDQRALSPAGAAGFWQFLKGTGADYGLEVNDEVDERYHLEKATRAACKYLKESYRKYNNWTLVAASYNAGRTAISRQLERQKVSSYYDLLVSEETSRYVFRILALKLILENPRQYGFDVRDHEKYPQWKVKTIKVTGPVKNFSDFAIENGTNYKILKMLNPWLRETFLTNAKGKTYMIKIPDEGFRTNGND